ncbi:MAG: response regulator [Leptolyngbyaceae cyanobacterium SU_3_3]|nr:response regulator [Leptolyngbyaceae cyanobacterium SU_3_3]
MPEVDGEALGFQIKSDPSLAQTKLIMMTSVHHWGGAKRMLELGFSAYLVKPVKQGRLLDCIVTALAPRLDPSIQPNLAQPGTPATIVDPTETSTFETSTFVERPSYLPEDIVVSEKKLEKKSRSSKFC